MHTTAEPVVSQASGCVAPSSAARPKRSAARECPRLAQFTARRQFQIKTFLLLFTMMFFCTAGNALLDKTMKGVGAVNLSSTPAVWSAAARTFGSGSIWLGLVCLCLFMVTQMLALSLADYSFVMPFSALSYALVPLAGYLWLGETVATERWIGIALIVCGVILVSRTPPSTTDSSGSTGSGGAR